MRGAPLAFQALLHGFDPRCPLHPSPALRGLITASIRTGPAREIGAGFPHFEVDPMLILLALILAASLIAMRAAGLWVG